MRSAASAALVLLLLGSLAPSVAAQDDPPPDICLTIGHPNEEAATSAITQAVEDALAQRPVLIPEPATFVVAAGPGTPVAVIRLLVWADGPAPGPSSNEAVEAACGAGRPAGSWSGVISGEFLRAGTKRELAAAPTTPGFSSSIDVEWDPAAELVRTVLTFAGPLDIPNGTCWMDDVVSADGQGGTRAETTTGSRTSPFGDGVCGRFEEFLPDGGAGAQAIVLLPRVVALPDGSTLSLRVDAVDVRDDGIHLTGTVESGGSS